MNKIELREQVDALHSVLIELIEKNPSTVKRVVNISKFSTFVKIKLENEIALRKLKAMSLEKEFVKGCCAFDIHESLNINMKEAKHKLKNFDFSTSEIDTIANRYKGSIQSFLDKNTNIN